MRDLITDEIRDAIALRRHDHLKKLCEDLSRDPERSENTHWREVAETAFRFGDAGCMRILLDFGLTDGKLARTPGIYGGYPYYAVLGNARPAASYMPRLASWYRCVGTGRKAVEMASEAERLGSLELVLRYELDAGREISADGLLFGAITSQDGETMKLLDSLDVKFTEEELGTLFEIKGWIGEKSLRNLFQSLPDDRSRYYIEKIIDIAENLIKHAPRPGLKIPLTKLFIEENERDLFLTPEIFIAAAGCFDFRSVNREELIARHLDAAYFPAYEKLGWLQRKDARDRLLALANENGKTEVAAYILDYVRRNVDVEAERLKELKKEERELNAAPDSALLMNKIWGHKKSDEGEDLISCKMPMQDICVPSKIGTKTITGIGPYALSYKRKAMDPQNVRSITVPDTVKAIKENAFERLSGLKRVSLPDGLASIGPKAFSGCEALESANIPESVAEIGAYAFYGCRSLKSAKIPETVTEIKTHAFSDCALESIGPCVHGNIRKIGPYAFTRCLGLRSVRIPGNVREICEGAFQDCSNIESAEISEGVSVIGYYAFRDCEGLTEITLPESLLEIDHGAFANCESLTRVKIPSNVKKLLLNIFDDCSSLESVELSEGLETLVLSVSRGKCGLKALTVPRSVKEINAGSFAIAPWIDKRMVLTLRVYEDSYAHAFCISERWPFELIGNESKNTGG